MGILTRAGDLVYTFRFLKLLVTPFNKTAAYELGIVDDAGKRDKSIKLDTPEKKSAYTTFHRLVYNIKRLMSKAPGGSSTVASYAAALLLIKEDGNLSDKGIADLVEKLGLDPIDILNENDNWFVTKDQMLSPGMYRTNCVKIVNSTCEPLVSKRDQVRVLEDCYPADHICGTPVYQATHVATGQSIYVSAGELVR
jgi:hypothetical protein